MTKTLLISLFLIGFSALCKGQPGLWIWMKGDSTINPPGVFGTMGISSPLNTPAGTYGPHIWIDDSYNLWIYGGLITNGATAAMWKYDIGINEWTWMSGTTSAGASPVYGTQGVFDLSNTPGGRGYSGIAWADDQGMFWLYGGLNGFTSKADLWKYDPSINQWAWIWGSQSSGVAPVWSSYQAFDPNNNPGSRYECSATWVDSNGHLWFYGGHDYGSLGYFSDMWHYDPLLNQWAWMSGPTSANAPPVYGTKGIPSPTNSPGGRYSYSHWKQGNELWLFGGDANINLYADMWRYDMTTNEWTWMSGSNAANVSSNAGVECDSSQNFYPASRHESRASAGDTCGNFWLSGGQFNGTFNDLWIYQTYNNTWTWINGSLTVDAIGEYNTQGVANPNNIPKSKFGSVMWRDNPGNLWIFGGAYSGGPNHTNDIWKYVPDPSCPALISSCIVLPSNAFAASDTTLCEKFCIDFTDQSTNSPTSWLWLFPGGIPSSSTDQNPSDICYDIPGTYDVTLITNNQFGTDTLTFADFITVNATPPFPVITQTGDTLISSVAASYQWQFNSIDIPGATNQSYTVTQTGFYTVIVADSNGCVNSATVYVVSTGMEDLFSGAEILVYPNPAIDFFTIELLNCKSAENISISIKNSFGQTLISFAEKITELKWKKEFDLASMPNGVYLIEVRGKNLYAISKIVLSK